MAITYFQRILDQAAKEGVLNQKTADARDWLRDKAQSTRTPETQRIITMGASQARNQLRVGQMFLFRYDPKTKDDLPYYDMYPLIFPFRKVPDGFFGINMHYLPPQFRALLMDSLYMTVNNQKQDETTRLRISYEILNGAARYRWFKPCVKHYLNSQVQTKFIYIEPKQWDIALFLPLHRFRGATAATVYRDSRKSLMGR